MVNKTRTSTEQKTRTTMGKSSLKTLLSIYTGINTNKLISNHLKKSKSNISEVCHRLKQDNLIYEEKEFNIRKYYLTKQGKDTCSGFISRVSNIKTKELPLRCHRMLWVSKIVRSPPDIKEKLKEHNWIERPLKNWSRYVKNFENFNIIWCNNVVQIHIKPFYTTSDKGYYERSYQIVEEAINYLQNKYRGLILGLPEETSTLEKHELAREFEPLAMFFLKTMEKTGRKITYRGDNIDVDFSKGNPETDYKSKTEAPQQAMKIAGFFDKLADKSPQEIQGLLNAGEDIKQIAILTQQNSFILKDMSKAITMLTESQLTQGEINNKLLEVSQKQEITNNQILYHLEALRGLNLRFDKPEYFG